MSWHDRGRYVALRGGQAHCVDVGEGPVVLLVHGFLHSSWTWRKTVADLSTRYRVIAPDLPGFGWGDCSSGDCSLEWFTDYLLELLDALGVRSVHGAVGNSLGGAALLELALREPALVSQLVLVSPMVAPLRLPDLPLRLLGLRVFAPLFRATAGNPAFVHRALSLTAYKRRTVDEEILVGFEHLQRRGSHRVAVETARRLRAGSASLAKRVSGVVTPITLVWGERDGVLPLRYGKKVAASLPRSRFEVFEGCGHCPQEEDPERFNALLRERLAGESRLPKAAKDKGAGLPRGGIDFAKTSA